MKTEKKIALLKEVDNCFLKLSGKRLPTPPDVIDRYTWIDQEAPYSILVHDTQSDPVYIYVNQRAISCFKYTLEEFLTTPSRLSATESTQDERNHLFDTARKNGIAYNYTGPRVDKYGNIFNINDCIVWEVRKNDGTKIGEAALFWPDEHKRPDWYKKHERVEV